VYAVQFEHRKQAKFIALGLSGEAILLAPDWLRDEVAQGIAQAAKLCQEIA
jgi:hypothetical protein